MADAHSELRPLTARFFLRNLRGIMDPDKDVVPVPLGMIKMMDQLVEKSEIDGPFAEMRNRLKPLLARYPHDRFYGNFLGTEPDGEEAGKPWTWVSMVPYRIFETFCNQHVHDWWYRLNLTRRTLELVAFNPNNSEKHVLPLADADPQDLATTPEWKRPVK